MVGVLIIVLEAAGRKRMKIGLQRTNLQKEISFGPMDNYGIGRSLEAYGTDQKSVA